MSNGYDKRLAKSAATAHGTIVRKAEELRRRARELSEARARIVVRQENPDLAKAEKLAHPGHQDQARAEQVRKAHGEPLHERASRAIDKCAHQLYLTRGDLFDTPIVKVRGLVRRAHPDVAALERSRDDVRKADLDPVVKRFLDEHAPQG